MASSDDGQLKVAFMAFISTDTVVSYIISTYVHTKVDSITTHQVAINYVRCTCIKYKNGYSHGSKAADVKRISVITTMSTITVKVYIRTYVRTTVKCISIIIIIHR